MERIRSVSESNRRTQEWFDRHSRHLMVGFFAVLVLLRTMCSG
jgi:hypothetical protein